MSTLLEAALATHVFCAPGYPGAAGDAQPLIDQFANAAVAASLVLSERAVEKHINSIFSKLALSQEPDVHRRVKAVLLFLSAQS